MEMNEPYPVEITKTISTFVDRIEQVLLQSGTPRSERTNVCTEVESQIHTMIERRLEAGAELNLELVTGIIESMDQPESYAKSVEPVLSPDPTASPVPPSPKDKPTEREQILGYLRKIWDRPARTKPGLDWVAVAGLVPTCLGLLLVLAGMARRGELAIVSGFFWIFMGVVLSGVSFWRIRHSDGMLTGQRIASIGVLMLPIAIANVVLFAILFATPIGRVLGALILVLTLAYANYRTIKYALRWLDSYSAKTTTPVVASTESVRQPEADSGPISGIIVPS